MIVLNKGFRVYFHKNNFKCQSSNFKRSPKFNW
jgi:hypothetical protein